MGTVLNPAAWCRQPWCRESAQAEHFAGDGCSCDPHGRADVVQTRPIRLKAHAARLEAFACRTCGAKTRDMVEGPDLFFRCGPCAATNRWPRAGGAGGR